ncbi:MAG: DUF3267 domain-containing protein [Clostridia bacterium]|nr:DUF3267 domain-containing protein [Clostridia bacterium]
MHSVTALPDRYREIFSVDLQKDKKKAILVNSLGVLIMLAMGIPMSFFVPFSTLFSMDEGLLAYFIRWGVLMVALVGYVVLHELTHALIMRIFGAVKVRFGFTGLYAFAGSEQDYFAKGAYILIALAPLVLLGVVILIVNFFVPTSWFWVVYMIQIMNVSGASGDLYVAVKFLGMPKDILVKDTGVSMTVYSRYQETAKEEEK